MNNRLLRVHQRGILYLISTLLLLLNVQYGYPEDVAKTERAEISDKAIYYRGVRYTPVDLPSQYDRERLASIYKNQVLFKGRYILSLLDLNSDQKKLIESQQQKARSDYHSGGFEFSELVQSTHTLFVEKNAYTLRERNILDKIRKSSTSTVSNEFTNFYTICLMAKFNDVNEMHKIPSVLHKPTVYGPSLKDYVRALPPEEILYFMPADFKGTPDQPTDFSWEKYKYSLSDLTLLIVEYFDEFASIPPHIYRSLRLTDAQMNEFSSVMNEKKRISREFVYIQSDFHAAIDRSFRQTNFTECLILIRFFEAWFPASAMGHLRTSASLDHRFLFRYLSDYEVRINEIYYSNEELDAALPKLKTNICH